MFFPFSFHSTLHFLLMYVCPYLRIVPKFFSHTDSIPYGTGHLIFDGHSQICWYECGKKFGGKIQNGIFYLSRSVIVKLHHIIIFIRWLQQIIVFFPSSPSSSYGYFWSAWIIFPNNIYQPISNSVGVLKYEIFTEKTMLIFVLRKIILSFVVYLYVWGNKAKNSCMFMTMYYFRNSYFLHWNFDWKSCFVVFFLEWNEWKNPQFNFLSQNLSIECNFSKCDGKETKLLHLLFHRIWKN